MGLVYIPFCLCGFLLSASIAYAVLTFNVEDSLSLNELKKSSAGYIDYLENQQGVNRNIAKGERKRNRVIAAQQQMKQIFLNWAPLTGSPNHTLTSQEVIFTTALSTTYGCSTARNFAGTARAAGFQGDIVVAVLPNSKQLFVECLKESNVIIYVAELTCEGHDVFQKCFLGTLPHLIAPVNLFRYYFYTYWSSYYAPESVIMLADFRDSFFQSNPFNYKKNEWYPPASELVLFDEFFPLKTIGRDMFVQADIADCYGKDVLPVMLSNSIVTTGTAFGSRDGIVTYATLIVQQYINAVRKAIITHAVNATTEILACDSPGIDQGFNNYLVHTGQLSKLITLKRYMQGEGPVNSIGSFGAHRAIIQRSLTDWKVLRGEPQNKVVVNWNGDVAPVVHQAERFLGNEFSPRLGDHFDIIRRVNQAPQPSAK